MLRIGMPSCSLSNQWWDLLVALEPTSQPAFVMKIVSELCCSFDWWLMAGADLQIYSLLVTADNLACENSQCTPKHENRGTGKAAAAIVASTVRWCTCVQWYSILRTSHCMWCWWIFVYSNLIFDPIACMLVSFSGARDFTNELGHNACMHGIHIYQAKWSCTMHDMHGLVTYVRTR